ncbi:metal-dependent protein hydrolase [Trichoderma citrinoviride]|uniref:Metal-dependent protein hydrolase n=1 Tax=Trichoderma citrinoviride TaxID=58853 RepID=A0A2T4B4K3_9HYPO|nr:metal-dependent protein hydrolase [Trichoderma citrinoviride]PTB64188.1 metal-dependent protein hydrolase [Trichoderma citrinoviride]
MAESAPKRLKTDAASSSSSSVLVGTHNGHFHADEALAVHMLRMLPAYRDSRLLRTRDPKLLEACHTVVDVGGEYDAQRNRYDHHQRGFETTFPGKQTKLSSAGLVYMHFGRALIAQRLAEEKFASAAPSSEEEIKVGEEESSSNSEDVDLLYNKIYESFIEAVDAHDNGISKYPRDALAAASIEPRFSSGGFTLGAMVGRLNPNWNDPKPADPEAAQAHEDSLFLTASRRIGEEFERTLDFMTKAWLPARSIVKTAFDARREHDAEGRILVLGGQSVPWKDHLYSLEEAEGKPSVLYVLYAEGTQPGAKWRIQCVPETADSFTSRRPLPEAWRGFRDAELDGVAGVDGCVFVHAAGFIGGNKTFEGALEMAVKALA